MLIVSILAEQKGDGGMSSCRSGWKGEHKEEHLPGVTRAFIRALSPADTRWKKVETSYELLICPFFPLHRLVHPFHTTLGHGIKMYMSKSM